MFNIKIKHRSKSDYIDSCEAGVSCHQGYKKLLLRSSCGSSSRANSTPAMELQTRWLARVMPQPSHQHSLLSQKRILPARSLLCLLTQLNASPFYREPLAANSQNASANLAPAPAPVLILKTLQLTRFAGCQTPRYPSKSNELIQNPGSD